MYQNQSMFRYPSEPEFRLPRFPSVYDFEGYWVYQFWEVASDIQVFSSWMYTNRTVNVSWACRDFNVLDGGDGLTTNLTYVDGDDRREFSLVNAQPNSTSYLTDPDDDACGHRCARVWAFQTVQRNDGGTQLAAPRLFECNITVSQMDNAYSPEYELPDEQARIAAGAIARQGFRNNGTSFQQRQYPAGYVYLHFGLHHRAP